MNLRYFPIVALTDANFEGLLSMTTNHRPNVLKCLFCVSVAGCHWMLPAGLWAGLVLTALILFGLFCWRLKRKSSRSGVCTRDVWLVWSWHTRQPSHCSQSPDAGTPNQCRAACPHTESLRATTGASHFPQKLRLKVSALDNSPTVSFYWQCAQKPHQADFILFKG